MRGAIASTAAEHLVQAWDALHLVATGREPERWLAWAERCLRGAESAAPKGKRQAFAAECAELERAIGAAVPPPAEPPPPPPVAPRGPVARVVVTEHDFGSVTLRCRWTHVPGSTYWDLAVLDDAGEVVAVCGYSEDPDDSPTSGRVCVREGHPLYEALFYVGGGFGWPERPDF